MLPIIFKELLIQLYILAELKKYIYFVGITRPKFELCKYRCYITAVVLDNVRL